MAKEYSPEELAYRTFVITHRRASRVHRRRLPLHPLREQHHDRDTTSTPPRPTPDIDNLFPLIFVLVGFWFILSEVVFFWLIFRFREKDGVRAEYITGEEKQQKRWITIPAPARAGLRRVHHRRRRDASGTTSSRTCRPPTQTVRVIAQQWAWTLRAPRARREARHRRRHHDGRRAPRRRSDKLYHFKLESRDVLHSFSVPVFRLKQDAIPGRVITGWFEPTKTGTYDIQCAEICGIGHGLMPAPHRHRDARAARGLDRRAVAAIARGRRRPATRRRGSKMAEIGTDPRPATRTPTRITRSRASSASTSSPPTTRSSPCSTCSPAW